MSKMQMILNMKTQLYFTSWQPDPSTNAIFSIRGSFTLRISENIQTPSVKLVSGSMCSLGRQVEEWLLNLSLLDQAKLSYRLAKEHYFLIYSPEHSALIQLDTTVVILA